MDTGDNDHPAVDQADNEDVLLDDPEILTANALMAHAHDQLHAQVLIIHHDHDRFLMDHIAHHHDIGAHRYDRMLLTDSRVGREEHPQGGAEDRIP